jgi:aminoglycoside N3'-acetyltransferase
MYERNAKIVFVGVTMMYNTMKHFVERRYVEWVLSQIPDEEKCRQMTAMVKRFDFAEGVWPYYNSERMQTRLEEAGLLRSTKCGNATLLCVEAKPSSDFALTLLQTEPDNWVRNQTRDWLRMCLGI